MKKSPPPPRKALLLPFWTSREKVNLELNPQNVAYVELAT